MKDRYENLDEYIADLRAALSQNCLLYTSDAADD